MLEIKWSFVHLLDVVVLHARFFDRLQEVYSWPGPQVNSVLHFAVFEPGSALLLPDGVLVELIKVCIYVVQGFLLDFDGLDTLRGDLFHHLHSVLNRRFYRWQERAVAPSCTRADDCIVVRKTRRRDTHVKIDAVTPVLLNGFAFCVGDFERRLKGDLETCGTYQHVHLMLYAIAGHNAFWCNLVDRFHDWFDVWLHECFEVTISRRYSSATRSPSWDDETLQLFVA